MKKYFKSIIVSLSILIILVSGCSQVGEQDPSSSLVCGNNICENGEANEYEPGGCPPGADPRCLGPPAKVIAGTCPEDCD